MGIEMRLQFLIFGVFCFAALFKWPYHILNILILAEKHTNSFLFLVSEKH